ncbi:hypothetical protein, partial [Saccharopolyspora sp. NPDC002686]|uniref:hypothetical protein n=1 Tax=Saccharopolyspora sp. NPDC002686 TaxID=3154541 RepID=UPI003319C29B
APVRWFDAAQSSMLVLRETADPRGHSTGVSDPDMPGLGDRFWGVWRTSAISMEIGRLISIEIAVRRGG